MEGDPPTEAWKLKWSVIEPVFLLKMGRAGMGEIVIVGKLLDTYYSNGKKRAMS